MKPDIIIGAADNYDWHNIAPWALSIKECGFEGETWLICYRVTDLLKEKCRELGINLYEVTMDAYANDLETGETQSHNLRMYHVWELFTRINPHSYEYAIFTDTSDVIFQHNPTPYLKSLDPVSRPFIVCPSEGLPYSSEEWGTENMEKGFGSARSHVANASDWLIYNVGTIAGSAPLMCDLAGTIYAMTEGRYYPSDQSSFNWLMHGLLNSSGIVQTHNDAWACQLGTTGDPTKSWLWPRLVESPPIFENGRVTNIKSEEYILVHQWNRHPLMKQYYLEKYNVRTV